MNAIEVRDLTYRYPGGAEALRGVSFDLREGESLALLGPNGAGKSTLILHLNGVLMGQGEIRVGGESITRRSVRQLRGRVGLVFANPDDQLFMPSVIEDVAFLPLNLGLPPERARERAMAALAAVGMAGHAGRPPQNLSSGEKRRVALATVLVMDADVLVLDEPTSGLDPRGRRQLVELLRSIPCARIIATHDLGLARDLCTRAIVLDAGRIVANGPIDVVLGDADLLQAHGLS